MSSQITKFSGSVTGFRNPALARSLQQILDRHGLGQCQEGRVELAPQRLDHHAMQASAKIMNALFHGVQSNGDGFGYLDQAGRPAQPVAAMRAPRAVEQALARQGLK